jgi:hypothetical protein
MGTGSPQARVNRSTKARDDAEHETREVTERRRREHRRSHDGRGHIMRLRRRPFPEIR